MARNSQGSPGRSGQDRQRPIPRRGAGKGGGRDRTRRPRQGRGIRNLNPFDITGRQRIGRTLRDEEAEPYRYDSNGGQIVVIKIVLVLWILLAIVAGAAEYRERNAIGGLQDNGFRTLPGEFSVDRVNEYIDLERGVLPEFDELTNERTGEYEIAFNQIADFKDAQDIKFGLFAGFLFLFVVVSVMVASFAYQANRNLLTLKSEGQRFSGTSAMLWLFVPFFNFFKGAQIFAEIWRGSDPEASTADGEEWKARGSKWWIDVWWITLAIVIVLNILFRTQFSTNDIDDRMTLALAAILADIFMIIPAVLALKSMTAIHYMQEKRHEIVGPHLAVPPVKGVKL